jgi:hypothetical protein
VKELTFIALLTVACAARQQRTHATPVEESVRPAGASTRLEPGVTFNPDFICDTGGEPIHLDLRIPAAELFDQGETFAYRCGGTRIAGASLECHSAHVQFFYEPSTRSGWRQQAGASTSVTCRPSVVICRAGDKRVQVDRLTHRAERFDHDQFAGNADCLSVATAGADTRCTGAAFSIEYDSHDFKRAQLVEPTGTTELVCAAAP